MPLIPLQLNDDLYLKLLEAASLKKVSVLDYIKDKLEKPEGWIVFRDVGPGEGLPIPPTATMRPIGTPTADEIEAATAAFRPTFQPAASLDEEYQCGFTRSHLIDARQVLTQISVLLGRPLAVITPPQKPACKDAQWQAQRILRELEWLFEALKEDDPSASATGIDGITEVLDPFWMVARDEGGDREMRTSKRHDARAFAEEEAERLCSKERKPFLVFQAVARCEPLPAPVRWQQVTWQERP